jgi:tetratricopeptide (TPR) repeat protein
MAAFMLGQNDDAETWLTRALKLNPRYAAASEWLGLVQYREGRIADAIDTYDTALKHSPGTAFMRQQLQAWRKETELQDTFSRSDTGHFTVLFEGAADNALAARVVKRLEAEYWRVGAALDAYPNRPINVVLYTQEQFRDITRVPSWSAGAYDGTIRLPVHGLAIPPASLERVLAHEFVHAVVNTMGGENVPVWLNEGLAMALEPGAGRDEEAVFTAMRARFPLHAIEGSFTTLSTAQATVAYAVSEHAVRRMIALRGAPAVALLVKALGNGAEFPAAFDQYMAMRYEDFDAMIARE